MAVCDTLQCASTLYLSRHIENTGIGCTVCLLHIRTIHSHVSLKKSIMHSHYGIRIMVGYKGYITIM